MKEASAGRVDGQAGTHSIQHSMRLVFRSICCLIGRHFLLQVWSSLIHDSPFALLTVRPIHIEAKALIGGARKKCLFIAEEASPYHSIRTSSMSS